VSITLGKNLNSLKAIRQIDSTTNSLSKSFERLSSGLRINTPSDDAAGLSVATQLETQKRIYTQGIRNVNDATSLVNIADGAATALTGVLTKIKELSVQAQNGSYSAAQRSAIDSEAQSLREEFNRIVKTTKFNNISLLDGSHSNVGVQSGGNTTVNQISIGTQAFAHNIIGDGTLQDEIAYAYTDLNSVATVDINNDGFLDIVGAHSSGNMYTFINNGDGTFQNPSTFAGAAGAISLQAFDANGDGNIDIAYAHSNGFNVALGNGDGTFQSPITNSLSGIPKALAVGDLNGDGITDIVVGTDSFAFLPPDLQISFGNGNGTFQAPIIKDITGIEVISSLVIGDINRDGINDVAVGGGMMFTLSGAISYFEGDASGTFKAGEEVASITPVPTSLTLGDFDHLGNKEILYTESGGSYTGIVEFHKGGYTDTQIITLGSTGTVADLNEDGWDDIITSVGSNTFVVLNNQAGDFEPLVGYAGGNDQWMIAADLNQDGAIDILSSGSQNLSVFFGGGETEEGTLQEFSLLTAYDAKFAFNYINRAFDRVILKQSELAGQQSRLQTASRNLNELRDSYASAKSRITDVDVAEETARLVRLQILQESNASVMAQANQTASLVLPLLGVAKENGKTSSNE